MHPAVGSFYFASWREFPTISANQSIRPLNPDATSPPAEAVAARPVTQLRELSPQQWKSGIAAWLGWTFDGLELHIYTLVAVPFVAELLRTAPTNPDVGHYGSIIQGAFLVGWALGGGFFGRI